MELGKVKLRRNGLNNLLNALHPDHGLIWTDGQAIYLSPVHLYRDQVEKAGALRLGEFQNVQSVHWSSLPGAGAGGEGGDAPCYMAAVHEQNVTVWHVSGHAPRLAFKQVRKINVHPIPQGCLWNPQGDVLCLLSRQQCSFYFRHTHNRGSFAFPSLEHEKISCGCWSPDGKRLVVCVGAALLIYTWADLEANISEFVTTAWKIPLVTGIVTAIVPAADTRLVCASDLPLHALCKNSNSDTFLVPGAGSSPLGSDGVLRAGGATSARDSLLNLQRDPKTQGQDSAMLTLIQLRPGVQDPVVVASAGVPALLSPDTLHFQVESQCVVVGSNTQNALQIFALLDSHLLPAGHLTLGRDQRPKGICGLDPSQTSGAYGVLVLVGATEPADATFPSTGNTTSYTLSLTFCPTRPEKARQLPNGLPGGARSTSSAALIKSESLREPKSQNSVSDSRLHVRQSSYKGERRDHRFRSPDRDSSALKMTLSRVDSEGTVHSKLGEDPSGRSLVEGMKADRGRTLVEDVTDRGRSLVEDVTNRGRSQMEDVTDRGRSLVEEVDGAQASRSPRELETEKVDFSGSKPQFSNSKLSHAYELSPGARDGDVACKKSSTSKSNTSTKPTNGAIDKVTSSSTKSADGATEKRASNKPANGGGGGGATEKVTLTATKSANGATEKVINGHNSVVEKPGRSSAAKGGSLEGGRGVSGGEGGVALLPTERSSPLLLGPPLGERGGGGGRLGVEDGGSSICSSFNSGDSNYEVLEKEIQTQRDQIDALQKRLADLTVMVEDTACVFPVKYQKVTEPEVVSIHCKVGGAGVSRKFLLDNGRLQLDPVRQAFGLLTVELILDGEPLVLGCNVDGYIPMKFSAGSVLQVTGIPVAFTPQAPHRSRHKDTPKS